MSLAQIVRGCTDIAGDRPYCQPVRRRPRRQLIGAGHGRRRLPPNPNVWAELGTAWRELIDSPDQAAHLLGKLLSRVGEDRVMWGTDAIWLGSPQPQIMAFRALEIGAESQEQFGYPALTPEVKDKALGLNGAALFGLDAEAIGCAVDQSALPTIFAPVRSRFGLSDRPMKDQG